MFFTVKSTKKAIATLIRAAEENRIAVEIRTNGDTETIYFDGKMVAERWSYYAGVILEIEAPCDRPFPEVGTPDYEALVKFQDQRKSKGDGEV